MQTKTRFFTMDQHALLVSVSRRRVLLLAALWLSAAAHQGGLAAADSDSGPKRQWAILIGIEKYHRANHLRYTINDVKQIARALCDYGYCQRDDILELLETASNPKDQPLKSSIMAQVRDFLVKPGPEDHVLVFFSGHGFRDDDGKLYLAPIDCDPKNAPATGVSVQWLREQIAGCKAEFKLLILDACHAGSEKGDDDTPSVSAKDLGDPFKDLTNVVTLASSTGDQKSQIWEDMQQSLYSYWLVQGLKGNANKDGDANITIDELYEYLHRRVKGTAKSHFPRPQEPVRIVRSGTPGVPVVVQLRPRGSLKSVLADMAESLDRDIKLRKLSTVGVLEFTNGEITGEALGSDFGTLGKYCEKELHRQLSELSLGAYSLVDRRTLLEAASKRKFGVKDLRSVDDLKAVAVEVGGMPVVAVGNLSNREGRVVSVSCNLKRTDQNTSSGTAAGTARLNTDEWAMLGRSVAVEAGDATVPQYLVGTVSPADRATERWDERSQDAHPLKDPDFPYRVQIMVNDQEREPSFKGNRAYVGLRPGEAYEIAIENHAAQPMFLRLLVDGRNTLPELVATKGMDVEAAGNKPQHLPAQVVNLTEARAWYLEPATYDSRQQKVIPKEYRVRGFFSQTGQSGKYNAFEVGELTDSLEARQQFGDQMGIITAAFYRGVSKGDRGRTLITKLGKEYNENVEHYYGDLVPGKPDAIIHLRYVKPEAIEP